MSKVCTQCKKSNQHFTGTNVTCNSCSATRKEYYKTHKYKETRQKYRKNNKNKYIRDPQYIAEYRKRNKKSLNEKKKAYQKKRYKEDPSFLQTENKYLSKN